MGGPQAAALVAGDDQMNGPDSASRTWSDETKLQNGEIQWVF